MLVRITNLNLCSVWESESSVTYECFIILFVYLLGLYVNDSIFPVIAHNKMSFYGHSARLRVLGNLKFHRIP